ncbi:LysE family translocator [Comamonas denitrificans]|uniref:LysE family translocator n=1 Tax=Comamonas denitrificans TaxID=117506 RepID=A0A939GXQ6_9BURK|nr:LysE family translocator [Comamonas denitrificans]MBO1249246.1 LysE family translocator [Comamonas denitrificans]
MPSLQVLMAFFGLCVVLALSPGPDNLFVLVQSAQRGWRVGLAVVVGLCIGILGHTIAVALGLAALVAASPAAFTALKLLGAAYLFYLAWGALRAPVRVSSTAQTGRHPPLAGHEALKMVGRGVVMNATNPKVLIFFLALLPQFADARLGPVGGQIVVLGGVFMLATFLVFAAIALFSGWFGSLLQGSARAQRWLNRATGLVLIGLAVRLVSLQRGP